MGQGLSKMPYAVAHVIITIVLADIYRDYIAKKKFPMIYVLVAGIAGLLPDMDIPAGTVFNFIFKSNYNFHRVYTHSLLYAIIFLLIGFAFIALRKKEHLFFNFKIPNQAIVMFFFAMSFGWLMHVALDCTFAADNIVHASCDAKAGCNFCDSVSKSVCDNSQPGWTRDYNSTHYITCPSGCPQPKVEIKASISCESGTLVKITRIVTYNGKPVKLVVAACG